MHHQAYGMIYWDVSRELSLRPLDLYKLLMPDQIHDMLLVLDLIDG